MEHRSDICIHTTASVFSRAIISIYLHLMRLVRTSVNIPTELVRHAIQHYIRVQLLNNNCGNQQQGCVVQSASQPNKKRGTQAVAQPTKPKR